MCFLMFFHFYVLETHKYFVEYISKVLHKDSTTIVFLCGLTTKYIILVSKLFYTLSVLVSLSLIVNSFFFFYLNLIFRFEQESMVHFNFKHFEELVISGNWDEVQKYLSGFTQTSSIFFVLYAS